MENHIDIFEIRKNFNAILKQHITKLMGLYYEIFNLSFTLEQLSCLILIREQIIGQPDSFPVCLEKYSKTTLFNEISDLGLETDSELDNAYEELIQNKYFQIDEGSNINVNKLTYSITSLLDKMFPGMCGMNLIAYIMQTMDEAISGRKDLAYALEQFAQTLQLHGVVLKKQEQQKTEKLPSDSNKISSKKTEPYRRKPLVSRKKELKDDSESKIIKSGNLIKPLFSPFSEPKIIPAFENKEQDKTNEEPVADNKNNETFMDDPEINEKALHITPHIKTINEKTDEKKSDIFNNDIKECPDIENTVEPVSVDNKIQENNILKNEEEIAIVDACNKTTEPDKLPGLEEVENLEDKAKNSFVNEDDMVENRIAAFEEDLAMQCPVCNAGKVISNKTAMDKIYYRCSNKQCSFISWGKPYYLSCPKCKNNFLVEYIQSNGQTVLRCPRATCRHTQSFPGEKTSLVNDSTDQKPYTAHPPVKKVVRKRYVRRRK